MPFILPKPDASVISLFKALKKEWQVERLLLFTTDDKSNKTICIFSSVELNNHKAFDYDILSLTDEIRASAATDTALKSIFDYYKVDILSPIELPASGKIVLGLAQNASFSSHSRELICFTVQQSLSRLYFKSMLEEQQVMMNQVMSEVSYMHEIGRAFETTSNLDNLLEYILGKAQKLLQAESSSLMMYIPESNELEFRVVFGPKAQKVKPFRLPVGRGIAGWVAQNQEPILIEDAYKDPRFDPSFDKRSGYRTRSILCVPMVHKTNTIGVMTVLNRLDKKPFEKKDKEAMMLFATQAALAIENARLLIDALEKERLHKELQVASEIQKKLIPDTLPVIKNLDISAVYLPSKEVSGDYYDVIQIDERRYAFVVADVAGKGIPGALLVSNMQASLYAYLEENPDLIHVVSRLNRRLINTTTSDRYITFFIGIYDMQAGDFTYVNAGHNPPILFKKDSVELLSTGGIFIGSMPWQYQKATIELKQGELLLLYTDGLVEAMDEKEEEFGEERLKQIVQDARDKSSADIESAIRRAVKKHTGGKQLDDDFTLIVIKRN